MKVKPLDINLVTLGCAKNLVDSEHLLAQLRSCGYNVKHDSESQSDIVIINTCGFINDAKEESIETILNYSQLKTDGEISKLIVMGCLTQLYREQITKEIPEIDHVFGVDQINEIVQILGGSFKENMVGERFVTTPSHYAYLKISEGCDRKCSFCIIPSIRGKHISQPIEKLVVEATELAKKGVKELLLIAQDLSYYGLDIYKKKSLAKLIEELSKIDGIEWIRLHYAYPAGFPLDVLKVMAENPKVCKYLDIPIQHINDRILKSMRRGIGRKETIELLEIFKKEIPEIALRTTLITGYPDETDEEFNELFEFVKETKFDRLGVFTYSPEEDTHAFSLGDPLSDEVKQTRADQIMNCQQEISLEKNKAKVGKIIKVLIDRKEGDYFIGRTEFDSPEVDNEVLIKQNNLKVGEFYQVKITNADYFDLFGEVGQ